MRYLIMPLTCHVDLALLYFFRVKIAQLNVNDALITYCSVIASEAASSGETNAVTLLPQPLLSVASESNQLVFVLSISLVGIVLLCGTVIIILLVVMAKRKQNNGTIFYINFYKKFPLNDIIMHSCTSVISGTEYGVHVPSTFQSFRDFIRRSFRNFFNAVIGMLFALLSLAFPLLF
jgi:hypothetical protein